MEGEDNEFTKEELLKIESRCVEISKAVINPYWKRLYANLHDAARHLELQTDRVTNVLEKEKLKIPDDGSGVKID